MEEEQDATRALAAVIAEANVKQHECEPGGEVAYLQSTGGYLHLHKDWEGQLRVAGAGNNSYLIGLASAITAAIGAIVVVFLLFWWIMATAC